MPTAEHDIVRLWSDIARHRVRYARFIESMPHKLVCQECGGAGGETDVVIHETGQGPWNECGWCEGTGYVTPWLRGCWLRLQKADS